MKLLVLLAASTILSAAPPPINLSRDLIRLGIAARNATPNDPKLDARPLFQSAIAYSKLHSVKILTADPGSYYFLTPSAPGQYLVLDQLADLTLDLHAASLYFQDSYNAAITLNACVGVILQNFSVDFLHLPFTQVKIRTAQGGSIQYQLNRHWQSPDGFVKDDGELWALAFRNGELIPGTNRLPLKHESVNNTLHVVGNRAPWTEPAAIAKLQPGDTLVIASRGGPATIRSNGGRAVTFKNIDIYSSGTLGLQLDHAADSIVDHVRVMPRPATDRLLSANADGIHLSYTGANNRVVDCFVSHTMDDGIAVNSPVLGIVVGRLNPSTLKVSRNYGSIIPAQTRIALVDPKTGFASSSFTVTSQVVTSEAITINLDHDAPPAPEHFGVILSDANQRGAGTVIARNTVEDVLSARGIYLGGVSGVTVKNNTIRRTSAGAIVLHEDLAAFPTGPSEDIQITGNTVDHAIGPMETGVGAVASLASIFAIATDANFRLLPTDPLQRITISHNTISHSGRSAIWVANTQAAVIAANTVTHWNQHPELALWGIGVQWAWQMKRDAAQPVVLHQSR